jgi:hypothetical protein
MKLLLGLLSVLLLGSCQAMSEGFFSFTGYGIVYEDSQIDDSDSGSSFDEEDIDLRGYGGQVAFLTPIVDFTGAVETRDYENEGATEAKLGLRRRILEFWRMHPYLCADARFGFDLDTGVEESDYTGWDAGIGSLLNVTDHFFFDFKLVYEQTGEDIELPSEETGLDGLVGTVGLGFSL